MKYLKLISVGCLLLICAQVEAQINYQQQYLNAKELFADENYSLSMEAFKPLMEQKDDNPFPAYASFYYAVAAYKQGYPPLAKSMFLQIREKFPKWSKLNEVNYWLAKLYFENEEYNQGLRVLREIRSKEFQESIKNLKYYSLSKIENIEGLKQLYENHESDKVIGEVLANKIASQPLVNQDQELLDELISRFDLDEKGLNRVKVQRTVFKDKYRVAVLFPFLVDKLKPDERKKVNQLVLDAYQGIQLAVDSLKANGVQIELLAYDTQGKFDATQRILSNDELKTMDLIIGPLFSEPRRLVQEFSFKNKINMINPLSTDSDVVGVNPYSFLFHPSNETTGRKTAEYIAKRVSKKPGIIFYGESKGDSALAYAYKQRIEEEGFEIIIAREIKKQNTREILDLLLISDQKIKEASSEEARAGYTIGYDSIGHIFVASNDDLISTKVISAVETRGDKITVIGAAEWLDLPVINYEVYQRLGVILYAPLYMKKESEAYERFRSAYVLKHKVPPTKSAEIGYDLMRFVGNSLKEHGKYFQIGLSGKDFIEGYLTTGYCYHNSQDNEVVPILEFGVDGLQISYDLEKDGNEN